MSPEAIDNSITAAANGLSGHSSVADWLMIAVTNYGAVIIVAAVAIRWWWNGAHKSRERHLAILCGASAALGLALNQVVLLFVHRARPYDVGLTHVLTAPSADPSFPSDHATLGFAVACALLGAGARRSWGFLIAAAVLSLSRLYVGTHYLSDVLGGALTAAVAAAICLALLRRDSKLVGMASRVL